MTRAWIVVDLGFGDAGKGTTVDFLVREHQASLVVRFNGGAQAGHNVVAPDGRHHTFSQLGAGSFVPGVRTHLASTVVVEPWALLREASRLRATGLRDALERLTIDPRALVITPYQRAINQMRERARGDGAHGTCGIGFGETVSDSLSRPELALRVADLFRPAALPRKLAAIESFSRDKLASIDAAPDPLFDDDAWVETWVAGLAELIAKVRCVADEEVELGRDVVFEGAQGVLLDEWYGFYPHTTWSTCTADHALTFLERRGIAGARTIGVTRTYATRHGAGPLPTETELGFAEPHNDGDGWQGAFRTGFLDLVLLRYALEICPVDGLALTHVDRRAPLVCTRYRDAFRLVPSSGHDLAHQERLTEQLRAAQPVLEPVRGSYAELLGERLGVPVALESSGPTCRDKRWRANPALCSEPRGHPWASARVWNSPARAPRSSGRSPSPAGRS